VWVTPSKISSCGGDRENDKSAVGGGKEGL